MPPSPCTPPSALMLPSTSSGCMCALRCRIGARRRNRMRRTLNKACTMHNYSHHGLHNSLHPKLGARRRNRMRRTLDEACTMHVCLTSTHKTDVEQGLYAYSQTMVYTILCIPNRFWGTKNGHSGTMHAYSHTMVYTILCNPSSPGVQAMAYSVPNDFSTSAYLSRCVHTLRKSTVHTLQCIHCTHSAYTAHAVHTLRKSRRASKEICMRQKGCKEHVLLACCISGIYIHTYIHIHIWLVAFPAYIHTYIHIHI